MEKLELKHLAPYLPYKLMINAINEYEGIRIMWLGENNDTEVNIEPVIRLQYNPILRPLSDLTQNVLIHEGFKSHIDYITWEHREFGTDLLKAPYEMIVYLFKNHFDVFGLINKGLAIDINTLNL